MNFRLLLFPFSLLYSVAARVRNFLFDTKILPHKSYPIPVILVGNLSTGGTGKTPHVEYLLELLRKDYRLATLSRGYGRKSKGFVKAGKGATSKMIGDEPMQYFSKFPDITVAVCEKRTEGIERLMADDKNLQAIIMDDGYQHRHVDAGFKILLTAHGKLFTHDYLLPSGNLREPRSAYERANCIIVTKSEKKINEADRKKIIADIHPFPHQKVFFSRPVYSDPVHFFSSQTILSAHLVQKKIVLFTGIADPSHLESYLKENSAEFDSITFGDHHDFNDKDIILLKEKFNKFVGPQGIVMTTEKDYRRLMNTGIMNDLADLPCYFIPIKIEIDNQENFNLMIRTYVEKNSGNS